MIRLGRGSLLVLPALWCCASAAAQSVQRDLAYGPDPAQRLDLSVPAGRGFSTVVFVHGGSLTGGDKTDEDYRRVCRPFIDAGIGCASVDYRLAPRHTWPAQPEDVARAVAWVRDSISARGGDPRRLFLFGHSSGATLVAALGTDPRYLAAFGVKPADLLGVIPMGSIMWDDDLQQAIDRMGADSVRKRYAAHPDDRFASFESYRDHWPIRHLHAGEPPFLFLIADAEREHPPVLKTNRKFVEESRALGNQAEYRVLAHRTHRSAIRRLSEPGDPAFAVVRRFIDEQARGSRGRRKDH